MVGKSKDNLDIDTMDIKNHLDASFDIDKIKVSEDLIAKTLLAIKESEKENSNDSNNVIKIESNKKNIKFLPLKPATIAAALFVFVVGLQVFNFGGSKKESGTEMSLNKESSDNLASDIYGISESDKLPEDNQRIDNSINSISEDKMETQDVIEEKEDYTAESSLDGMEDSNKLTNQYGVTMSNLYPIDYKGITEFTIKDEHNNLVRTSTNIELVNELYAIIDKYILTKVQNNTLDYIYEFDILTDERQSYTILIGNGIYVKTSDKVEYTYYEINNKDELLIKLEDFIRTMP